MLCPQPPCVFTKWFHFNWCASGGGSKASCRFKWSCSKAYFVHWAAWKWSIKLTASNTFPIPFFPSISKLKGQRTSDRRHEHSCWYDVGDQWILLVTNSFFNYRVLVHNHPHHAIHEGLLLICTATFDCSKRHRLFVRILDMHHITAAMKWPFKMVNRASEQALRYF